MSFSPIFSYSRLFFLESGNLLFAFLPGDGFLLAIGVIAATGTLHIGAVFILLLLAATLGYALNYLTGWYLGKHWLQPASWIANRHLDRSRLFYQQHGVKAVIAGRFFPYIRTIIPFLAGVSQMNKASFFRFNLIGAVIWIGSFVGTGYLLGDIPFVQHNFFLLYIGLVILTLLPVAVASIQLLYKRYKTTTFQ